MCRAGESWTKDSFHDALRQHFIYSTKYKKQPSTRLWSLIKLYLHAHHFLYKLDYNSKWNTQEKYPQTSSQEEVRLIKGKVQRAKVELKLAMGLFTKRIQKMTKKKKANNKEVIKVSSGMSRQFFFCFFFLL